MLAELATDNLTELPPDTIAIVALVVSGFVALITFGIAIFNFRAVCEMKRQGNVLLKQTKASILQKCTESYIVTRRQRAKAIIEKSPILAEDYHRAICDIYWNEFQLYSDGLVSKSIMRAWLYARKRDYDNGQIDKLKDDAGNSVIVKCSEVWEELIRSKYFLCDDPFVNFMGLAHRGEVDEALKIKDTGSQT